MLTYIDQYILGSGFFLFHDTKGREKKNTNTAQQKLTQQKIHTAKNYTAKLQKIKQKHTAHNSIITDFR